MPPEMDSNQEASNEGVPELPPGNFAEQVRNATKSPEYRSGDTPKYVGGPGEDPPPQAAAEAPPVPSKIRIGGQEFDSVDAAVAHARELAARAQGKEDILKELQSRPPEPPKEDLPQEKAFEEQIEDLMFTDTKAAVKMLYERAKQDAIQEVTKNYREEQTRIETEKRNAEGIKQFWGGFYKDNPDLQEFGEVIDNAVVVKHWNEIKDLPQEQAKKFIEEKTRALLRLQKQASQTKQVLYSSPAHVASSSTAPGVRVEPGASRETALDFISQVNKHRKKS